MGSGYSKASSSKASSSSTRSYDGKTSLQSVGEVDARKVSNLKSGDILMWNFGSTSRVVKVEPSKTGKTFNVIAKSSTSGETYERKMSANTLVGIAEVEAKDYKEQRLLALRKGKRR